MSPLHLIVPSPTRHSELLPDRTVENIAGIQYPTLSADMGLWCGDFIGAINDGYSAE